MQGNMVVNKRVCQVNFTRSFWLRLTTLRTMNNHILLSGDSYWNRLRTIIRRLSLPDIGKITNIPQHDLRGRLLSDDWLILTWYTIFNIIMQYYIGQGLQVFLEHSGTSNKNSVSHTKKNLGRWLILWKEKKELRQKIWIKNF